MSTFKLAGIGERKVLLLPGLFGTRDSFDMMLQFADKDRFQYAAIEYRGYGHSRNVNGLFTLGEAVLDVVRVVDHLGWTEFSIAGHSVGALLAQMIALALPRRVQGVVSLAGLNAGGAARDENRQKLISEAAFDFDKRVAIVTAGTSGQYTKAFAAAVAGAGWNEIAPKALASFGKSAAEVDIRREVEGSTLPMLVVVGELDRSNTAALARETTLKWYRNAELQVLPQVGHYPMIEAPAATISAIEKFFGRL